VRVYLALIELIATLSPKYIKMSVSIYMCVLVCICVSVRQHISGIACLISQNFSAYFLCPWLDPLLASSQCVMYFRFMDDVICTQWPGTGTQISESDSGTHGGNRISQLDEYSD